MKRKAIFLIGILVISAISIFILIKNYKEENVIKTNKGNIVTSLDDKLSDNARWCGTFNLVWNDLKDVYGGGKLTTDESNSTIDNLNKSTFTTKELNKKSYYKDYGYATFELKKQIEKEIKTKFNETSDILNDFNFAEDSEDFFLYAMLKKEFEYQTAFNNQGAYPFNGQDEYDYFGYIHGNDKEMLNNVQIIHYDENIVIMKLITKGNDELYFYKGYTGETFKEIFDEIKAFESRNEKYDNSNINQILIPYITIKDKTEIKDVEGKKYTGKNGKEFTIEKAIQTLVFDLNEKGGKVKSEAGIGVKNATLIENYNLAFNSKFVMFIKEKKANLPYLALKVDSLDKYQDKKRD